MKTQIKKVAFVAAITMVCGICFLNSQKSETMSEIALANVEALADKTPTHVGIDREDCEEFPDLCSMIVIYSNGDQGEDIVVGMTKKAGWL